MRPYQLQSLQFMLDCERRPGGYRSLFWVPMVNGDGRQFWYSPIFSQFSIEVPEQPSGGFLSEEMVGAASTGACAQPPYFFPPVCSCARGESVGRNPVDFHVGERRMHGRGTDRMHIQAVLLRCYLVGRALWAGREVACSRCWACRGPASAWARRPHFPNFWGSQSPCCLLLAGPGQDSRGAGPDPGQPCPAAEPSSRRRRARASTGPSGWTTHPKPLHPGGLRCQVCVYGVTVGIGLPPSSAAAAFDGRMLPPPPLLRWLFLFSHDGSDGPTQPSPCHLGTGLAPTCGSLLSC